MRHLLATMSNETDNEKTEYRQLANELENGITCFKIRKTNSLKSDAVKLLNRPHHERSTFLRKRHRCLKVFNTAASVTSQYGIKFNSVYKEASRAA